MPKKIDVVFRYLVIIITFFLVGVSLISARESKNSSQIKIQIYYSGAQSGYIEPCG